MKLDETSLVPYFHQIKKEILSKIEGGELKENEKLPSETRLAEKFGVSRPTVRKALDELVFVGYLWRKQGKGTFVSPAKIKEDLMKYMPFIEKARALGKHPQIKILSKEIVHASSNIAQQLQINEGDSLIELVSLRLIEGQPMNLRTNYYPIRLFPDLFDQIQDNVPIFNIIGKYLADQYGLYPLKTRQTFQVVLARDIEANLLKVKNKFPLILWEGILLLNNGKPYELARDLYRSDKYQFYIEQNIGDSLVVKEKTVIGSF
jgi:GntR family transcriptional regulator